MDDHRTPAVSDVIIFAHFPLRRGKDSLFRRWCDVEAVAYHQMTEVGSDARRKNA
jgi:hypothetical protein